MTSDTVTVGTDDSDEYHEIRIEPGMIHLNNVYYTLEYTPGANNSLLIQDIKARYNFIKEV